MLNGPVAVSYFPVSVFSTVLPLTLHAPVLPSTLIVYNLRVENPREYVMPPVVPDALWSTLNVVLPWMPDKKELALEAPREQKKIPHDELPGMLVNSSFISTRSVPAGV